MEESLPPRNFVTKFHLPQLIRIRNAHMHKLNNEESLPLSDISNSVLDLDQPFLLYKAYPCRQVIAYTLDPDGLGNFKRVGPALLIPENYAGWFSIVTNGGHTAGYFTTIDQVTRSQVPCFLTKDDITGYHVPKLTGDAPAINQTRNYNKVTIPGGQVLRLIGLYEDISAIVHNLKKNTVSKKHRPDEHGMRYAKCIRFTSMGGEIVFIPITESGRFYIIAKRTEPRVNSVFPIGSLLRIARLPMTVQLVVGPKPRNYQQQNGTTISNKVDTSEKNFSAILRLEEIRIRDVILACTIRPQPFTKFERSSSSSLSSSVRKSLKNIRGSSSRNDDPPLLLEFDLDSSFMFHRTFVEKNGSISSRKIPDLVLQRIAYCNTEAEIWRKQIKIAHDVIPRNSILDLTECTSKKVTAKRRREPILQDTFDPKLKTASIGSRASSTTSKTSRISRVLQHLWNPLKKRQSEECLTEDEGHESLTSSTISEYHYYETLKNEESKKKEPFSRRDTLDVVFSNLRIDDDGYILKAQRCIEEEMSESLYSTIEKK